ncbi:MAG TPA: beta-ketoacyl-[acyl-carrier-protein] synthase family protein [Bacteroidales bacterium]|nr:beta-ketoacyl-[acyl-carrier-protein] synthase family protein [Bacteroidales bacterium]
MPKVCITGIGIICAAGSNSSEVLKSLAEKRTGIGHLSLIQSIYKDEIPAGEIKKSNEELYNLANPDIRGYYSRTALLGLIAVTQAIRQAALSNADLEQTALISGTTVGGMDRTEVFYDTFRLNHNKGKIKLAAGHDCGAGTEDIARNLGINGFQSTINTACSSSANAIMMGARLIQHGKAKRVIAGGTDSLTKFTLNGFNSLMILDREQCRPFDDTRNGLNLGEGSGFLVLESEEVVGSKPVLAVVKGWGNACDAYHQTASSPDGNGAYLAMQKALQTAGIQTSDIQYINTHGTGTKNNDLSEGIAIERLFSTGIPPCSSTKSYTGHTLGAAGGIEAVFSVLAIQNHCIFPNLNFNTKMQELGFEPAREFTTGTRISHVMSNSFGFGGNNSSLIFSEA